MRDIPKIELPIVHLQQLEFLLGEGQGVASRYSPGLPPDHFEAFISGSRETCDRYVRVDYFAEIPNQPSETFRALFTYSAEAKCFRCWTFSTESPEPAIFSGEFEQGCLVMVSEPYQTQFGLQRLRQSFAPLPTAGFFYLLERWELEGWTKHYSVTFLPPD